MSSQISTDFTKTYSFSCCALMKINEWNKNTPEDASKVVKMGKLITTEIVTALLIPAAVIEALAQAIISLLVKTVHFFIPEDKVPKIFEKIYLATVVGTMFSFATIALSSVLLVKNLVKNQKIQEAPQKILTKVLEIAAKCQPFMEAHIDTICASKK